MRCWCGYPSAARCRLFAYGPGPADALHLKTPSSLVHLNPDWFYLSGTGLHMLSWKRGQWTGVAIIVVVAAAAATAAVAVAVYHSGQLMLIYKPFVKTNKIIIFKRTERWLTKRTSVTLYACPMIRPLDNCDSMFPSDACSVYTMTTTHGHKNQLSQTDPRDALPLVHRVLYNVNVQRRTCYTLHGQGRRRRTSTTASTVNLVRPTTVSQSILQSSSG